MVTIWLSSMLTSVCLSSAGQAGKGASGPAGIRNAGGAAAAAAAALTVGAVLQPADEASQLLVILGAGRLLQ